MSAITDGELRELLELDTDELPDTIRTMARELLEARAKLRRVEEFCADENTTNMQWVDVSEFVMKDDVLRALDGDGSK